MRVERAVECTALVSATTGQSANVPRTRIDGDHRALNQAAPTRLRLNRRSPSPHGTIGGDLCVAIECSAHGQVDDVGRPAFDDRVDQVAHGIERKGIVGVDRAPFIFGDGVGCRLQSRQSVGGDISLFYHQTQHQIAALEGALRMTSRSVRRRRFRECSEHRCLRQSYPIDALAEQISARRFHSVDAVPHIDDVEVELEDLLLGQRMLDQARQSQLGEFLPQRSGWISPHGERVTRDLHCNRAETFAGVAGFQVGDKGTEEAAPIEPAMLVKAAIFGGDERLPDEIGNLAERDVDTPHQLEPAHYAVVAVEDASALVGLESLDVARRRAAVEAARQQPHVRDVDR